MSLKITEFETLVSKINDIAEDALESGKRADMSAALEEISDLSDADAELSFDGDDVTVDNVDTEIDEDAEPGDE